MLVRDKTIPKTEYKGRPTEASDDFCPCRPCYLPHDCGHDRWITVSGYQQVQHVINMECATRWNGGCPQPKPEPEHVYTSDRAMVCKRCGMRRAKPKKEVSNAD